MTTDVGASSGSAGDDVPRDPSRDAIEGHVPSLGHGADVHDSALPEAAVTTRAIWLRFGLGVTVVLLGLWCAVPWATFRPLPPVAAPSPTASPFFSSTQAPSLPVPLATPVATPAVPTTAPVLAPIPTVHPVATAPLPTPTPTPGGNPG
ncbi:MAG: hypothetical protein PVSMB4_13400 [Ktedonobacterales bacterium]